MFVNLYFALTGTLGSRKAVPGSKIGVPAGGPLKATTAVARPGILKTAPRTAQKTGQDDISLTLTVFWGPAASGSGAASMSHISVCCGQPPPFTHWLPII